MAGGVGLLSACTGAGTPSPAASLACMNFQGKEGGGSDYLDCLRLYRLQAPGYGASG